MRAKYQKATKGLAFLTLILFLFFASLTPSQAEYKKKSFTYNRFDLDGDGKKDRVLVQYSQTESDPDLFTKCIISINDQSLVVDAGIYDWFFFPANFISLNSQDKKTQIAICHGMDNSVYTSFFIYDEKEPKQIATVPGIMKACSSTNRPDIISINSKQSIVQTAIQSDILLSWEIEQNYIFANDQLYLIDQDYYDAIKPQSVKVIQDFIVFSEKDRSSNKLQLTAGETIILLGTDNYSWVKIKDKKGKILWINMYPVEKGYSSYISKPDKFEPLGDGTDYLDGLQFYG